MEEKEKIRAAVIDSAAVVAARMAGKDGEKTEKRQTRFWTARNTGTLLRVRRRAKRGSYLCQKTRKAGGLP